MSTQDSNLDGALIGGAVAAAAPVASHLRYEAFDLPQYRRDIRQLVDQASAQNKIFAAPAKEGYRDFRNPLQRQMKLGDVIL